MKSRRTFIKLLAGISAFIIPWTILPRYWGQKIEALLGKPPVKLDFSAEADQDRQRPSPEALEKKAYDDILALSHPDMQGRRAGTAGETRALVYIQEQLESLRLKPCGEEGYWQMFSVPPMQERYINGRALFRPNEADSLRMPAANILAGLPGRNTKPILIISAHYDHLGFTTANYARARMTMPQESAYSSVMRLLSRFSKEANPLNIGQLLGAEEMVSLVLNISSKNRQFLFLKLKGLLIMIPSAMVKKRTLFSGRPETVLIWITSGKQFKRTKRKSNWLRGKAIKAMKLLSAIRGYRR
jgi:hypothetical protein